MSTVPLRLRLVGVVVLLSALALTLSGLAATTALRGYLLGQVDAQLSSSVSRLSDSAGGSQLHGIDNGGGRSDPLTDAYAEVISGGTTLHSALRTGLSAPSLPVDLSSHRTPFTVSSLDGQDTWRVQVAGQGGVIVVVALPLDGLESTMTRLIAVEVIGGAAVLVLLAGVGYVVVRRSLRPLVQVGVTAGQIAAGDLSLRVPEGCPRTEVGSLSKSFNTMVAQIETAFAARAESEAQAVASEDRMRRFVADASHELRTPLTSIRGFAELYRQGALPARDDVDLAMSRVESEARRMGELVDDLLLLARLDRQRPLERTRVDLVALAGTTIQDARAAAPDRTLRIHTDAETCLVAGDSARLAQVLANLLTNALVHTPPSAAVTVRISSDDEQAVLAVIDDGPGIKDVDKPRIFERFYRADVSRTRASGGSGLGLSIVAGIVRAHGGSVEVLDTPGGGTTFCVKMPLLPLIPAQNADREAISTGLSPLTGTFQPPSSHRAG
jgi:two-component system OmpR family sensor kinase